MDTSLQTVRRATVGMSVLGWVALLCLVGGCAFWWLLFLDLLQPASPFTPQAIQSFLAVVAYSLVLPLFWSMLLPSSPAGRLLQKQSWRTPGYGAVVFAAVFLTYHAGRWLYGWWGAQPAIDDAGEDIFLTITSLIAGVLVPALSWCVMTPEQWIAQIEQARQVRRLEQAMRMEEAAMRAAYARAVSLLNADLTNLTIAQRRELAGILGGFARIQQHALQSIAASWRDMYGVEAQIAVVPDQELLAQYREVAQLLAGGADAMSSSAAYSDQVRSLDDRTNDRTLPATDRPTAAHQDTVNTVRPNGHERPNDRVQRTTSGPLADHRTNELPHSEPYDVARYILSGAWKRADLERVLRVSKTQAHQYLRAWQEAGVVVSLTEPKDSYQFVGSV